MTRPRTTPAPTPRTVLRATALAAVGAVVGSLALVGPAAATTQPAASASATPSGPVVLSAHLSGANEVSPTTGAVGVGDPDGSGDAAVRFRGGSVDFALSWSKIEAPTRGHIHIGAAGVNGGIEVAFFEKPDATAPTGFAHQVPGSAAGVTGTVEGLDPALLAAIAAAPGGYYVNVHNDAYPAGAVRGQLGAATTTALGIAGGVGALESLGGLAGVAADPGALLRAAAEDPQALAALGGLPGAVPEGTYLGAVGSGAQEVGPDGSLGAGDPDGRLASLSRVRGRSVDYALAWSGIDPPTRAHLHAGVAGTNGPVVVPFFELEDVGGLPPTVNGIVGSVRGVDAATITGLRNDTAGYYANVHTAPYPAGAVRGQLVNLNDALRP